MLSWLQILANIGPLVLLATPLAHLAPYVSTAIQLAEALPGATGLAKQQLVLGLVQTGVAVTNAQVQHPLIDPPTADTVARGAITTIIAATNLIHRSQPVPTTPVSAPPPSSPVLGQ